MYYIATFHTHLGAISFRSRLRELGDATANMMPVPRALSSSCGTCVRFEMAFDKETMYEEDIEKVAACPEDGRYDILFENED